MIESESVSKSGISHSAFLRSNVDLSILNFGYVELAPGQEIKCELLLHYRLFLVTKGNVFFNINGEQYTVRANEMFLIPASYAAAYTSDPTNPAFVYWLSFWGLKAKIYLDLANLTIHRPVYSCCDDSIRQYYEILIGECRNHNEKSETKAQGCIYFILSVLLAATNRKFTNKQLSKFEYAQTAVNYIRENYMNDIKVSDISKHLALNRTYFSTLFKDIIGISPVDYLIRYRIDQAVVLMANPRLSLGDIALLAGFGDIVSFSIRFKALAMYTPSEYRKLMFNKDRPPIVYLDKRFHGKKV